ncbi:MAG: hypothetical protein ABL949_16595 [Fimbriimonadaceae bacterium]
MMPASQLTTQVRTLAGAKATLVDGYDVVGNRVTRNTDGTLTTWVYDAANRLTNQQLATAFTTFTMDEVGNVTVKNQQGSTRYTMTYNAAQQLVTMPQGTNLTTITFDLNGNLTLEHLASTRTTDTFDKENRLIGQLVGASTRSTYTFDGDGQRRTAHENGGTLTTMIWDGTDCLGEKNS